jgi:hypothetical protein
MYDSVCLRGCILLFLDKDVCILYLQARVYRCRRDGRYDLEGDVL